MQQKQISDMIYLRIRSRLYYKFLDFAKHKLLRQLEDENRDQLESIYKCLYITIQIKNLND